MGGLSVNRSFVVCSSTVLGWLLVSSSAVAQQPESVIVTGNRTGLDARQIGSAVTVITAEDIDNGQMLMAKDILQDVAGVQISNDRPGAVTGVYIRGSDNDQVLVLLDGLELGDPSVISTAFQFDHLNTADIERIEVLRGNQSSLYGSDAIGGVINVITRQPDEGALRVDLDAEGGSYGLRRVDGALSGRSGRFDYRVGIDALSVDGPSRADPNAGPAVEDDAYDRRGFTAQFGIELTSDLKLRLRALRSETETELDGTGEDATFLPSIDKDESVYAVTLVQDAVDSAWHHEFAVSAYEAERFYDSSGDRLTGDKQNLRYFSSFDATDRVAVAFGIDLEEESTDQLTSFSGSFLAANQTNSAFAEVALSPLDRLTLTMAARSDDNERFGRFDTHRVTAAYVLASDGPEAKLRASWGTGAKAPGLYQLFDPTYGNQGLGVEQSDGYDIGVDWFWSGGSRLEVSYFNLDIENEVDFQWPVGYLNLGETDARGIETFYSRPIGRRVDWSLSYTYLASHDRQADTWLGRPRNTATMQFAIDATSEFKLTARTRYRSMNAASFGGTTDSFVAMDLLGSYALTDTIEIYGRLVNVFDKEYQYEWGSSTYDRSAFAGFRVGFD
jgi:vitamin B12 transporter